MKSLIQKLVETASPSGYEAPIRDVIRTEIKPFADEIWVDALGNLIARRGQVQAGGQKIMLSAHMDEIGLIVTHIDEKGFIRFTSIGGVYPRNCVGARVLFLNGQSGVIYLERQEDANRIPPLDQMYIDVGASSRQDVSLRVGDVGVFDRPFLDLGTRLVSKAMDDRISVTVLIETLRRLSEEEIASPNELYFVFSVQEEVGLRGAQTAAYGIDPQVGVSVDVTATGDTPKGLRMQVALGQGPAIKVRDGRMLSDPRIVDWMIAAAQKLDMPYQLEVLEGGTTDATAMQVSRAGMPVGCISIPCRYVHSQSEMVEMGDVEKSIQLLIELLRNPVSL